METIKRALADGAKSTTLFVAKVLYKLGTDIHAEHIGKAQYPFEMSSKRTKHGLECALAWREVVVLLTV
jgi:hypothetical protein